MPNSTVPAAATGLPTDQPRSSLIRDPFVRGAFQRAERDQGIAFTVQPAPQPELTGGAAEEIITEEAYMSDDTRPTVMPSDRRGFLRMLAGLPLIGGA